MPNTSSVSLISELQNSLPLSVWKTSISPIEKLSVANADLTSLAPLLGMPKISHCADMGYTSALDDITFTFERISAQPVLKHRPPFLGV